MRVKVRALASLRHYLPGAVEEMDLDVPDAMTVREIIEAAKVPHCEIMKVAIDDAIVRDDHVPHDGDLLEIFPIYSGG